MATAALTSLNRFFCVLKPAVFKRVFTYRRSLSHIGCLAVVAAFAVLVPIVFGWATFSFNPLSAACAWKFTNRNAEIGYTCLNLFTFPVCSLSIMTYCYKEVSRFIRQHKVNIAYLTTHEIHITKALFVIVFVFFASFCVPSFLAIILFRVILHGSRIPREMVLLALYLVHANSAINPWIYGVMSPLVRNKIKKVFFKRRVQLQAGDVTLVRAYQRKSKPPKENIIAPDSTLQNVITQKWLDPAGGHPGVECNMCLIELSRSTLLAARGFQTTSQSSTQDVRSSIVFMVKIYCLSCIFFFSHFLFWANRVSCRDWYILTPISVRNRQELGNKR